MQQPEGGGRDARFDILKGIAILAVLVHHVTGFGLGLGWHGPEGQLAVNYLNHLARFAVPTFILVSVYLVGKGIAAREAFEWRPYLLKRGKGTLYPYLVWTFLYLALHALVARHATPLVALGFKSLQPVPVLKNLFWIFAFGKASFHLYFMVALLQVQVVLPWLIRSGKKWFGDALWKWLLAGVVSQVAVYVLSHQIGVFYRSQGQEPPLPPFSSMFYGFLLPTVLGAGLAVCVPKEGGKFPGGTWVWALPVAIYFPYAYVDIHPAVVAGSVFLKSLPNLEEGLFMVYSTAAGVALISLCGLMKGKVASWLTLIGADSLGIYLMHPIVLELLRSHSGAVGRLPLAELWVFLITLGVTWGALWGLQVCRLDRILFGR